MICFPSPLEGERWAKNGGFAWSKNAIVGVRRRVHIIARNIANVDLTAWTLTIESDKAQAGNRIIPIHGALQATVAKLVTELMDGFLFPGLTTDQDGFRGDKLGERFGKLKAATLGEAAARKSHKSFRHTVITILENALVPPGIIADVVGHEKNGFSEKTYSDSAYLEVKRATVEKITYEEMAG